jgi:hypothetical protein
MSVGSKASARRFPIPAAGEARRATSAQAALYHRARFWQHKVSPVLAISLVATAAITSWYGMFPEHQTSAYVAMGVAIAATCVTFFFIEGGRKMTPAGLFALLEFVFVGLSAVLGTAYGFPVTEVSFWTLVAVSVSVIVVLVFGSHVQVRWTVPKDPSGKYFRVSWIIIGVGVAAKTAFGGSVGPLPQAIVLAGIAQLSVSGTHLYAKRLLSRPTYCASMMLGFAVYSTSIFTGGGRLTLASTALVIVIPYALLFPARHQKALALLALVGFLVWSGLDRNSRIDPRYRNRTVLAGLNSVYNPLHTMNRLVAADLDRSSTDRAFPRQYGRTFAESSTIWIPRKLWAGKPKGFGARLTEVLEPRLVSARHSMAALAQGEFYVNFGLAGLPLFTLVAVSLLRKAGRRSLSLSQPAEELETILNRMILVLLLAGMGDFLWVGFFTVLERTGFAAFLALLARLVFVPSRRRKGYLRSAQRKQVRYAPVSSPTVQGLDGR